jgi:hypothetical protein
MQCFCHFLNAFCKLCSALSVILPWFWLPQSCHDGSIFNGGNREKSQETKSGEYGGHGIAVMLFLVKNSLVKFKMVHYHNARANSFATKFWVKIFTHFHAVTAKGHSSIQNSLSVSPFSVSWLFHSNTHVWVMLSFLNTCLIARVSVPLVLRSAQNLMNSWWINHKITSG